MEADYNTIVSLVNYLSVQFDVAFVSQEESISDDVAESKGEEMTVGALELNVIWVWRKTIRQKFEVGFLYRRQFGEIGRYLRERARMHQLIDNQQIVKTDEIISLEFLYAVIID